MLYYDGDSSVTSLICFLLTVHPVHVCIFSMSQEKYHSNVSANQQADPDSDCASRKKLRAAVETIVSTRFIGGNRVQVLKNGDEIFPAMLSALSKAEKTIDFLTFIYWEGETARKFAEMLANKARQGVRVRVVLDAWGSMPMDKELVRDMNAAGVQVEHFRPKARWKFWENDHRTHRKILVIDDQVGFTGGVGIASEWEGDARNSDEWRDTHFLLDGPIAMGLKATFLTDWRDTGHAVNPSDADSKDVEEHGDVEVALIDGSVQIGYDDAERVLEAMIAAAEQRILIQTPYFNPSEIVLDLMKAAIDRGVAVELLVPGPHIDKRVSKIMAEDKYSPLIDIGARVWIFQPTMMHVKAFLVDGIVSMVGSINVNRRSMLKDEETAVVILNEKITQILEEHFHDDISRSRLSKQDTNNRSIFRKVLAKLLKPVKDEI